MHMITNFARRVGLGSICLTAILAWACPANAQLAGDPDLGARVFREISNCHDCHGWAGDGVPDNPQMEGANLRLLMLPPELVVETIRCGRPGTLMPSFQRNTYTERIPCYGLTQPLAANLQPRESDSPLNDRYLQAVVAFLFRDFVGAGPVTREYCETVFEVGAVKCEGYPTEAEVAAQAAAGGGAP